MDTNSCHIRFCVNHHIFQKETFISAEFLIILNKMNFSAIKTFNLKINFCLYNSFFEIAPKIFKKFNELAAAGEQNKRKLTFVILNHYYGWKWPYWMHLSMYFFMHLFASVLNFKFLNYFLIFSNFLEP